MGNSKSRQLNSTFVLYNGSLAYILTKDQTLDMTLSPNLLHSLLDDNHEIINIPTTTSLLEQRDLITERSRAEIANRKIINLLERAAGLKQPKLDTQLSIDALELEAKILECYKTDKVLDCHALVKEYSTLKEKTLKEFIKSA
jgi:hypothetical protein